MGLFPSTSGLVFAMIECGCQLWAGSAASDSQMWVVGGDQNTNGSYRYNWQNDSWIPTGSLPVWDALVGPGIIYFGGSLFMVGGAVFTFPFDSIWVKRCVDVLRINDWCCLRLPTVVLFSTTPSATNVGWSLVPAPSPAPAPRSGHSLTLIEGYAVVVGACVDYRCFPVHAYSLRDLHRVQVAGTAQCTSVACGPTT
jgi:hypothetical protein